MEEFYKKKIIRGFLSLFSESKWKNLCILCLEYGILQLKKNYNVASLSLDDIEQYVDELQDEDIKNQKKNNKKFETNLQQSNISNSQFSNSNNSKPTSNWRKGEKKTIFDIDSNNNNLQKNENNNSNNNNKSYIESENNVNKPTAYNNRGNANWRKGETKTIFDCDNNEESIYNYTEINKKNNNINYANYANLNNENNCSYSTCSEASLISRMNKEKILDDILYPKPKKTVNYNRDNYIFGNNDKYSKNKKTNYVTTYNNNFNAKKMNKTNYYNNTKKNNRTQSSNCNTNFSNKKLISSNSNSNMKFNSGLQMLKMKAPVNARNTRSFSKAKNGYDKKLSNIPSRIKSQIEADKKIYELMKKQYKGNNNDFAGGESTITYKKTEMSFEEDFTSLV